MEDEKRIKGRFAKGHSGNLKGRPKRGTSITETMRAMLDKSPEVKEQLAQKIIDQAKAGDMAAVKLLWNYLDGLPIQRIVSNNGFGAEEMRTLTDEELANELRQRGIDPNTGLPTGVASAESDESAES